MNTYLQMSALAYIILIGVIYFGKRNIDTVENKNKRKLRRLGVIIGLPVIFLSLIGYLWSIAYLFLTTKCFIFARFYETFYSKTVVHNILFSPPFTQKEGV